MLAQQGEVYLELLSELLHTGNTAHLSKSGDSQTDMNISLKAVINNVIEIDNCCATYSFPKTFTEHNPHIAVVS